LAAVANGLLFDDFVAFGMIAWTEFVEALKVIGGELDSGSKM